MKKKLKWKIYSFMEKFYEKRTSYFLTKCIVRDPDEYGQKLEHCIDKMFSYSYKKFSLL